MAGGPTVNLADRVLPLLRACSPPTATPRDRADRHRSSTSVSRLRRSRTPRSGRACTADRPGHARPREAGLAARRRDHRRFNGVAVTSWDQLQRADPRQRRRRGRDRRTSATASRCTVHDQHHGRSRGPTSRHRPDADRRSASSASSRRRPPWCHRRPALHARADGHDDRRQTVEALATLPVKVWGVAKAIVGVEERAADSPVSIVGGGRVAGETVSHDGFPVTEKAVFLLMLVAGLQPLHRRCSTSSRCCRSTAATSPARSGRRSGAASPGCAAGPTPGTSTSPSCCRSPTSWPSCLLVMGVVLIVGDIVVPLHLPA